MKSKEIRYISVRVLSIYIFIQACISIVNFVNFTVIPIMSGKSIITLEQGFSTFIFPFTLLILIGIVLWYFSDGTSNHIILKETAKEYKDQHLKTDELQSIVFTIVGVVVGINALLELIRVILVVIKMLN